MEAEDYALTSQRDSSDPLSPDPVVSPEGSITSFNTLPGGK